MCQVVIHIYMVIMCVPSYLYTRIGLYSRLSSLRLIVICMSGCHLLCLTVINVWLSFKLLAGALHSLGCITCPFIISTRRSVSCHFYHLDYYDLSFTAVFVLSLAPRTHLCVVCSLHASIFFFLFVLATSTHLCCWCVAVVKVCRDLVLIVQMHICCSVSVIFWIIFIISSSQLCLLLFDSK